MASFAGHIYTLPSVRLEGTITRWYCLSVHPFMAHDVHNGNSSKLKIWREYSPRACNRHPISDSKVEGKVKRVVMGQLNFQIGDDT